MRATRRDLVLAALRSAHSGTLKWSSGSASTPDGWVRGWLLTNPEIGGMEALRRLRELRERGYVISMRPIPGSSANEYRLDGEPVSPGRRRRWVRS